MPLNLQKELSHINWDELLQNNKKRKNLTEELKKKIDNSQSNQITPLLALAYDLNFANDIIFIKTFPDIIIHEYQTAMQKQSNKMHTTNATPMVHDLNQRILNQLRNLEIQLPKGLNLNITSKTYSITFKSNAKIDYLQIPETNLATLLLTLQYVNPYGVNILKASQNIHAVEYHDFIQNLKLSPHNNIRWWINYVIAFHRFIKIITKRRINWYLNHQLSKPNSKLVKALFEKDYLNQIEFKKIKNSQLIGVSEKILKK